MSHRPLTLVLAKEHTAAAIKEALFGGRTLIWFYDTLIGKEDYLKKFFEGAVRVQPSHYATEASAYVTVTNTCDVPFRLEAASEVKGYPSCVQLPARASVVVSVPKNGTNPVAYKVTNLLTAYEQCIEVSLF